MHLTDPAVHQQLFLDVLNGTKALVSAGSSEFLNFPMAPFLQLIAIVGFFFLLDPVKLV